MSNPAKPTLLDRIKGYFLASLARHLRPYLARTPLIWGDENRLHLGHDVHLVDAVVNLRSGTVTIGDYSFLGHGVMLLTGKHDVTKRGWDRHAAVPEKGRDIRIGRGVWIASGAIVVGPCQIGDNAVIGAGALVTGTVAENTFVVGSPERRVSALRE